MIESYGCTREPHPARPGVRRALRAAAGAGLLLLVSPFGGGASAEPRFTVTDTSFKCLQEMTQVRHFYVDNLLGRVRETVDVAEAGKGEYPEGSVLQLMPNEVMIKLAKGTSPATRDWEFFFIDVSPEGSKIYKRGFTDVNNRLGLNCFTCHAKAEAQYDMVCETGHGCDPIPVTRAMFGALQRSDPRCKNRAPMSAEDKEAMQQLGEIIKALTAK